MPSLKQSEDIRRSREIAWLVGAEAVANVSFKETSSSLPLCPRILCPRASWSVGAPV